MHMSNFIILGIALVIVLLIVMIVSIFTSSSEKELTKMGNAVAKAKYNVTTNNKEILKKTADETADIHKDAVETIMHSVKNGLSDNDKVFCKYCGEQIDADSTFCKKCGRKI